MFPRSAVKALQALPLVESGAAERYAFTGEELALACASHSGEPGHVAAVVCDAGARGPRCVSTALRCAFAARPAAAAALFRAGVEPSALHNNCSGKHAGFLCLACRLDADPRGYCDPGHPVQREVRAAIESVSGAPLSDDRRAIDGCSVPTWAMPLADLALAFARFGTGHGLAPAAREGGGAAARGLRGASLARRRHRPFLHRGDAALRRRACS